MAEPTRTAFTQELTHLDEDVLCLAAGVAEALAGTAEALSAGDADLARRVVAGHAALEADAHRCETRAYEVLARQQPAAGDLRLVLTAVRLSHELERAAKLVKHVATFAATPRAPLPARLWGVVARMGHESHVLFQGALEAYVDRDVARAEALDLWDDRLDDLHRQLLAELFAAKLGLATTLELALVGRYLERIADHAVTVGDRVRYLVTGRL